ncbi:MAG: hypothetical protein AAGF84_10865 [Planctomycetota bacterium]
MPKQAIVHSAAGQRVAVAAFMLLLLSAVTGLAFTATLRPKVEVAVAGLSLSFPADWALIDGQSTSPQATRVVLENERRQALRTAIQYVPVVDQQHRLPNDDPTAALRVLFPMMAMAPLPDGAEFETREIGNMKLAFWTGVLRSRLPIFGQTPLSVFTLALVTDDRGNYWSISMRDDNYRHEDPAARVTEHRKRFLEIIETLGPDPATEIKP